jgi:predicted DsbA family dithiol-disulfide isomerase
MIDAQYQAQKPGGMSLDELVSIASQIGLDPDLFLERLERGQYQQMIIERRSRIADAGVRGTPSVMINGRLVASESKSRTCMNELIAEIASGNS